MAGRLSFGLVGIGADDAGAAQHQRVAEHRPLSSALGTDSPAAARVEQPVADSGTSVPWGWGVALGVGIVTLLILGRRR